MKTCWKNIFIVVSVRLQWLDYALKMGIDKLGEHVTNWYGFEEFLKHANCETMENLGQVEIILW